MCESGQNQIISLLTLVILTNFVTFHSATHKLTEHIVLKIRKKKIKHENHDHFLGVLLDSK